MAELKAPPVRCGDCGRFIPHADLGSGRALYHFTPDSAFTAEEAYWTCAGCRGRPGWEWCERRKCWVDEHGMPVGVELGGEAGGA